MSPDDLRAAIETALRRRDPTARVWFYQRAGGRWPAGIEARCGDARMTVVAETDDAALRDLARLCGLHVTDDGVTDPAEECERLRADITRVTAERDALRAAVREYLASRTAAREAACDEASAIGRHALDAAERAHSAAIARVNAAHKALRAFVEVKP